MKVRLRIERVIVDELLLEGEAPGAVQRALESELSRLLALHSHKNDFLTSRAVAELTRSAPSTLSRQPGLGQCIASAVHESVTPSSGPRSLHAAPNGMGGQ